MTVTIRPVDPVGDLDHLTAWVTSDHARFWGMQGRTRDEVSEIYRYIDDQEHLAAYLLLLDEHPVGVLQTYDPEVDEIGECYDRRSGDVGVHLLLAEDPARLRHTAEVVAACLRHLHALPGCRRLVFEPDARNARSLALLDRLGADRGPAVDLRTSVAEKPAQFFFLDADRLPALVSALA